MSANNKPTEQEKKDGVRLMPHEYDGIQEYDQRLPNWWLFTLYGAIVFAVFYWFYFFQSDAGKSDAEALNERLSVIEAQELEAMVAMLNDDSLWQMSQNPEFVTAGEEIFQSHCYTCHGRNLEGGIGLPLNDSEWKNGSTPTAIYKNVANGIPNTGMAAGGGRAMSPKEVAQAVAYVLSHHDRSEMEAAAE